MIIGTIMAVFMLVVARHYTIRLYHVCIHFNDHVGSAEI